jgi:hypothetical protein
VLTRDEQGSPAYDTPANSALYQAINHLLSRLIRGVGAASVSPNSD